MVATIALNIHHSVSLLVAPSGFECVLACQGNLSLHYAAIYEPIFDLQEPQQLMEKKPTKIRILQAAVR